MSDTSKAEKNTPPVHKILSLDGLMTIAIWPKATEHGPRYSITMNRRYKDKDGNWHDSDSYFEDNILELCEMERDAYAWIKQQRRADAQARKEKTKQPEPAAA